MFDWDINNLRQIALTGATVVIPEDAGYPVDDLIVLARSFVASEGRLVVRGARRYDPGELKAIANSAKGNVTFDL